MVMLWLMSSSKNGVFRSRQPDWLLRLESMNTYLLPQGIFIGFPLSNTKDWVHNSVPDKALNESALVYLSNLLEWGVIRGSRKDDNQLLIDPRVKMDISGGRPFSKAAPVLWIELPLRIRQYGNFEKLKNLKTYLFHYVYQCMDFLDGDLSIYIL